MPERDIQRARRLHCVMREMNAANMSERLRCARSGLMTLLRGQSEVTRAAHLNSARDLRFDRMRFPNWIGREVYHGYAGIREFFAEWFGPFDRITFDRQRIEVVGNRSVSVARQRGEIEEGATCRDALGFVSDVRDERPAGRRRDVRAR
jgi:hypothetical protein